MTQAAHPEIYAKLTTVFHEVFADDEIVLTPETTAEDVDGWDSLAHVRLMLTVERAFGTRLSASEVGRLSSVGDLVELLARKTGAA